MCYTEDGERQWEVAQDIKYRDRESDKDFQGVQQFNSMRRWPDNQCLGHCLPPIPPVPRISSQGLDSMLPGVNVLTSLHRSEPRKPKKPAIVSFSDSRVHKLCRHSPSCILPTNHTSTTPTSLYSLHFQPPLPQTLQIQWRETRIQEGSPLRDR